MFLDSIVPSQMQTGYGGVGLSGGMGYPVLLSVNNQFYEHSISAHPPSRLRYDLEKPCQLLSCRVALNDSAGDDAEATFMIYADGILQAVASRVRKHERPRALEARLYHAKQIELVVESTHPDGCHALWIDPVLHESASPVMCGVLNRVHIVLPQKPRTVRNCIGIVGDDRTAEMLDNFLGSLYENGQVKDCHVVIMAEQGSTRVPVIARKYRAQLVEVRRVVDYAPIWIKTAAYSLAHIVQADRYLVFDSDMLVLDQVKSIFASLEAINTDSILAVRETWIPRGVTLGELLLQHMEPYAGNSATQGTLNLSPREMNYEFIVNGGLFGGSRKALLALDNVMRAMSPEGIIWMDQRTDLPWREQALFNLALARLGCGQELDARYNTQLLRQPDVDIQVHDSRIVALNDQKSVNVLHFNGDKGRERYLGLEEFYLQVRPCEFGNGLDDNYENFEEILHRYALRKSRESGPISAYAYDRLIKIDNSLRFVYQTCLDSAPERLLDLQTDQGAIGVCMAYYASKNIGHVTRLAEKETELIAELPEDIKACIEELTGNVFVSCKKMIAEKKQFGIVALDTSMNEKNTFMLAILASQLMDKKGAIILHDKNNPLCSIESVTRKLRQEGFSVKSNLKFRPDFENNKAYVIEKERL